ncbi:hypothetical protein [Candidatus Neomicrothrix sp.]|uniref:hypothetical protein n=1 Tax=Candidatus Neomicrothrix sp. TaxID=2719034 RepID=UPI001B7815D1|nr:hypothetical protein [Candidatus Microthrix sp.]MBP7989030.1 hypothetical protein [Candidatus Microthrix sp.]
MSTYEIATSKLGRLSWHWRVTIRRHVGPDGIPDIGQSVSGVAMTEARAIKAAEHALQRRRRPVPGSTIVGEL